MRVVKPGRGNSLVRVHHYYNFLSSRASSPARPGRKAVTVRARPGRGLGHRAEQRPPPPRAVRSGIIESRSESATTAPSADRRSYRTTCECSVTRDTTTPRHRPGPTNPALGRPVEPQAVAARGGWSRPGRGVGPSPETASSCGPVLVTRDPPVW